VEQVLADLAMAGATSVVTAMATSAWGATRTGMRRVFHRDRSQQESVEGQLDADAALVTQDADADAVRQDLVPVWNRRLTLLLRQHPDAANDLRALVDAVRTALPQAQQQWVMNVTAHGGVAAGAQGHGSGVHIHNYPNPDPPPPIPGTPADDAGTDP
jgi:hypothetical protein